MSRQVVFISSVSDALQVIKLRDKFTSHTTKIICNFPPAYHLLTNHGISVVDSELYYPATGKSYTDYQKIVELAKVLSRSTPISRRLRHRDYYLGDVFEYSFVSYLAEIQHSMLVAREIFDREQPRLIFTSTDFTESPMKTYQSGKFNGENVALAALSRRRGIKVISLNKQLLGIHATAITLLAKQLLQSLVYTIRQIAASESQLTVPPLVILANHYQLSNLLPLINTFEIKKTPLMVVGKISDRQLLSSETAKIPFINFSSSVPIKSAARDLKLFIVIKSIFRWISQYRVLRAQFSRPEMWSLVKWKLFYFYLVLTPSSIETLNFADTIFSKHPKVLLTTATNDVFSKCFALSAKRYGVMVVEIQHGLLILDEDSAFRYNDVYATWGPAVQKLLDRHPRQNSQVIGYPYKINSYSTRQLNKLSNLGREYFRISKREKVILVLGSFPIAITRFFSPISTFGFIKLILKGAGATDNHWHIIFRPHPSYNPTWIDKLPKPRSLTIHSDYRQVPLDQAVAASDLVIANHTTAILEPLLQKKPLLLYFFKPFDQKEYRPRHWMNSNAATLFHTPTELTKLLTTTPARVSPMRQHQVDKFLHDYFSFPTKVSPANKLHRLITNISKGNAMITPTDES